MKNAIKRSYVWKVTKTKAVISKVEAAHREYVETTPPEVRIKRLERAYWYVMVPLLFWVSA